MPKCVRAICWPVTFIVACGVFDGRLFSFFLGASSAPRRYRHFVNGESLRMQTHYDISSFFQSVRAPVASVARKM